MHVLISGPVQVGKSTLIHRLLEDLGYPVCGFETHKEESLMLPDGGIPIYIYPAGGPYVQTLDNRIGISCQGKLEIFTQAFDRFVDQYSETILGEDVWKESEVILMDEIGHMESQSQRFCDMIMKALDGERLVIAAVKYKQKPFLDKVREHPNTRCFFIDEENRDSLYKEILSFIRSQEYFGKAGKA